MIYVDILESEDIFACSDDEDILPRDASTPRVAAHNQQTDHITNQRFVYLVISSKTQERIGYWTVNSKIL